MELDHGKLDVYRTALDLAAWAYSVCRTLLTRMIERGNQVREDEAVYGYVNENGNDGEPGQQAAGPNAQ